MSKSWTWTGRGKSACPAGRCCRCRRACSLESLIVEREDLPVHQKSVLTNGLRVITEEDPHFHAVAVGLWLNAGSRDEAEEENGLTHFLGHMAFKGPARL